MGPSWPSDGPAFYDVGVATPHLLPDRPDRFRPTSHLRRRLRWVFGDDEVGLVVAAHILATVLGAAVVRFLTTKPGATTALRFHVALTAEADPPTTSFPPHSSPPGAMLAQMSGRSLATTPRSTRTRTATRALRSPRTTHKLVAPRKGGGVGVGHTSYGLHALNAHLARESGPLRATELDLVLLPLSAEP